MRHIAAAAIWMGCLLGAPGASAQTPGGQLAAIAAQVDAADARIDTIRLTTRDPRIDDAALKARIAELPGIDRTLDTIVDTLTPRETSIDARLAELGSPPAAGQPGEAPEIARERTHLQMVRRSIDTELKQARLLIVEADQLSASLDSLRRRLFSEHLWARDRSIVDPQLWRDFARAIPADIGHVTDTAATGSATIAGLPVALIALGAVTLMLFAIRPMLDRLAFRRAARHASLSSLQQSGLALAIVATAVVLPLIALWLLRIVLQATSLLDPTLDALYMVAFKVIVFTSFVEGLARSLLSPRYPGWRLAPIADAVADRLRFYPALIVLAVAIAILVSAIGPLLGISAATSEVFTAFAILFEIVAVGSALANSARDQGNRPDAPARAREASLPWVLAAVSAWLAIFASGGAVLLGYLALATFLMRELIWIAVVLASLFLLVRLFDDLGPALLAPGARAGKFLRRGIGLSERALDQIAVLLTGAIRVVLFLIAWAQILAPFGAGATDMLGRINSADLVIHLGQVTISPGVVIGGVLIFFIGLLITRGIRSWLERSYLPTTSMDLGVRTSVASAITYAGALVAVVVASAYLGLSLDRIALLASALSVGIGFGLQSIISNFVSGLILLAERPVRVGDWIAIGDLEGDIKRINVRATEIEMRDRSRLIVPNSDLVTKTIRNVTHGAAVGRIRIILKVDDSADPVAMRDLLSGHLAGHAEVLPDPAPSVFLTDARDGGLEFTCFAYVHSARDIFRVRSELLFAIIPSLRAAGFSLANSTPVVNIGLGDRQIEPPAASE